MAGSNPIKILLVDDEPNILQLAAHSGLIEVESAQERGSLFRILLQRMIRTL